jgi:hypothetical protein
MGILFPPAILWLDFKSKEELQLMPQTMEEHLDELESEASDADISFSLNDEHDVSLFTLVVIKEANFVMNINETNHNIGNYRLSSILLEIDIILYLSQLRHLRWHQHFG